MKIAVIGSGISGLAISYLLNKKHNITLFEKNDYIGGHSRTVEINDNGKMLAVDTGFIVFNKHNYPLLTSLFKYLDVKVIKSAMSFGVSIEQGEIEYGTNTISSFFGQKKNLASLSFWKMIYDIFRFNSKAKVTVEQNSSINLGQLLEILKLNSWFKEYYLLPMGGSIWSTSVKEMLNFPAITFINFFDNHGLLSISNQPQWYTVEGGSKEYVKKISQGFLEKIKLNARIEKIVRGENCIEIHHKNKIVDKFDHVILATHSDTSLKLLESPSKLEQDILGSINYQKNLMVLHSDINFMPRRKKAWSSWVYLSNSHNSEKQVSLSYWMNNLQSLNTTTPIIVTLNPATQPNASLIYDVYEFEHPVFNQKAIDAQKSIFKIQGENNVWYCGAWQRHGFHEDGLLSAVNLAKQFDVNIPWQ
jgi:predicted NAD/FAD-binding protein